MKPTQQQIEAAAKIAMRTGEDDALEVIGTFPDPEAVFGAYQQLLADRYGETLERIQELLTQARQRPKVYGRERMDQEGLLEAEGWVYGSFARPAGEYWHVFKDAERIVKGEAYKVGVPFDWVIFKEPAGRDYVDMRLLLQPWPSV